jgi:hypothetical protein
LRETCVAHAEKYRARTDRCLPIVSNKFRCSFVTCDVNPLLTSCARFFTVVVAGRSLRLRRFANAQDPSRRKRRLLPVSTRKSGLPAGNRRRSPAPHSTVLYTIPTGEFRATTAMSVFSDKTIVSCSIFIYFPKSHHPHWLDTQFFLSTNVC